MVSKPGILDRWRRARRGECAQCGETLSLRVIPLCTGVCGDVTVSFTGIPCLGCDHPGHPRRLPDIEFGERLIDAIFPTGDFPAGKQQPLGGIACRRCGARVKSVSSFGGSAAGEFAFPGLPEFRVVITGPAVRCDGCGREQIFADREAVHRICEAMSVAFRQANLSG